MKIALIGPRHSGKSCLTAALREALSQIAGAPRPFPLDTTPDGEGTWFAETARRHPDLATQHKSKKKRPFDWEWTLHAANSVKRCRLPLVLVDTGGILNEKLAVICQHVRHAILVVPEGFDYRDWMFFIRGMNLKLLAVVRSRRGDGTDSIQPGQGSAATVLALHGLDRGCDRSASPAVQWLARRITRGVRARRKAVPLRNGSISDGE
jgi:CRISPR-associated protein Csx3